VTTAAGTFLRSRWVEVPDGTAEGDPARLAPGFRAAGVSARIKPSGEPDVGLIACDREDVRSALLVTRNAAAAAPVRVCIDDCERGALRAVVANSGNANASTGEQGYRDALAMQAAAAEALGVEPAAVAVAQTGVIGVPLPIEAVLAGIADAAPMLSPDGAIELTRAIMTTDRGPKACTLSAGGVTLSAQAKGAGMIEPGFATMLCFVQTDAQVTDPEAVLRGAVSRSFERITVDGQMSTNDTVVLQASGASGLPLPDGLLDAALLQLALDVVADGEGASRIARVDVSEAASNEEAERVARAVANSQLVQTALAGRDPNWGRVAQAAGMALAGERIDELGPDRIDASDLGSDAEEAELRVRLGRGEGSARVYFSDLTCDYVRLNAEYTT
jgi:glutamate N-acetyltransferase / amino-acid N-acetyltransferase